MGLKTTDADLQAMLQEVDVNRSGTVGFEEFETMMTSHHGSHETRLELAFDILDENANGAITADELIVIMEPFGLTRDELSEMIAEVDLDGDGAINLEEFSALMPDETEHQAYKSYAPKLGTAKSDGSNPAADSTTAATPSQAEPADTATASASAASPQSGPESADAAVHSTPEPENEDSPVVAQLKAQLAQHPWKFSSSLSHLFVNCAEAF